MYSQFKAAVDSRDISRANRYEVNVEGLSLEENLLCIDAECPSPNIITFNYKHQGPAKKIPYDVEFGPLSLTFMSFGDNGQPYNKFIDWLESIYDENYRFNDKSDYERTIIVKELNRQNSTTITHTYNQAFPINIGPKSKSMGSSNTPDQFTVNFEYFFSTHS